MKGPSITGEQVKALLDTPFSMCSTCSMRRAGIIITPAAGALKIWLP